MATLKTIGRLLCAAVVLVALAAYLVAVLNGRVASKLGATDIAVVVVALGVVFLLAAPQALQSISRVQIGNVLDLELRQLRLGQEAQKQELDDLRFALALLVSGSQRDALNDLERARGEVYWGNPDIRTDLRRLAAMSLIRRKPGRHIGELSDDKGINLAELVELTPDGTRYLARVRSVEHQE